ncbi:hypothetical protein Tsubulata_032173, partial [Turnera subulata]
MLNPAKARLVELEHIKPDHVGNVVKIDLEDVVSEATKWVNALVGFVFGADPQFTYLSNFVVSNWKLGTEVRLYAVEESGVFIFVFSDHQWKKRIIDEGPWFLDDGRPLILKPWEPSVSLIKEVKSVPVWIKLPGLNLHLRTPLVLSKIASLIGRPLFAEKLGEEVYNIPRICVEIDADTAEIPEYVVIETEIDDVAVRQKLEVECLPPLCKACKKFGHTHDGEVKCT